jgi:delta 1-pyrroline-5-carboxylate dehydrogenase
MYQAVRTIDRDTVLSRPHRNLLLKAGKAIGQLNTDVVRLQAENEQMSCRLNELERTKKRQRVVIDPNKLFADVENVKQAMDAAAKAKADWEATEPAIRAERAAMAAQKLQQQDMEFIWDLKDGVDVAN